MNEKKSQPDELLFDVTCECCEVEWSMVLYSGVTLQHVFGICADSGRVVIREGYNFTNVMSRVGMALTLAEIESVQEALMPEGNSPTSFRTH